MSANQAQFAVAAMARVLGVSTCGYYAWRRRTPSARACSDARLKERIGTIHTRSRSTYGAPRICAALVATGTHVAQKRVARLMRTLGVSGVSRRRGVRTTRRQAGARAAPDLVGRVRLDEDTPRDKQQKGLAAKQVAQACGRLGRLSEAHGVPARTRRRAKIPDNP